MHWKRFAHAFLLGIGFSVAGAGCAAFNAMVSSSAGSGAHSASPERLTAIGRVFENQGRYAQAQAMYRRALKSEPGNSFAQDRLQYIASHKASRTFDASSQRMTEALAVADSIATRSREPGSDRSGFSVASTSVQTTPATDQSGQASDATDLETALSNASVVASLTPAAAADRLDLRQTQATAAGGQPEQITESQSEQAEVLITAAATGDDVRQIETIGFTGRTDAGVDQSGWKATRRSVSLEEVLEWLDAPQEWEGNLLEAVQFGDDPGVQALAASALAECQGDPETITHVLRKASQTDSELLTVTVVEVLVQRHAVTDGEIQTLLNLMASEDSEIRIQAAGSLRNLAGTEWAGRCVTGLAGMLHDDEPMVVEMAAATLGDFGADASELRPTLTQVSQDHTDAFITRAVIHALDRIPVADSQVMSSPPGSAPISGSAQ